MDFCLKTILMNLKNLKILKNLKNDFILRKQAFIGKEIVS